MPLKKPIRPVVNQGKGKVFWVKGKEAKNGI